MKLSFDDEDSFKEVVESLRFYNPPSDPNLNSVALALQEVDGSSDVPPQERNEDICRVGSSTPPQDSERSEVCEDIDDIRVIAA
jgi:hypothetical protein